MKSLLKIISSCLFLATAAYAQETAVAKNLADLKSNLQHNLPDLTIERILATPVAGVYEVDSGHKVFYVDSSGNYALIGNLLDLRSKTSLTEQRSLALNRVDWQQLPLNLAIVRIKGNGHKNRLAIFTDPDCPFCKRLEAETLSKLTDVSLYYFLFPLPIHPLATDHAQRILCAENPESAMLNFMTHNATLGKNNSCSNIDKLSEIKAVATDILQISGTPTMVLPNGRIISGLVPLDYLNQMLADNPSESA